VTAVDVPDQLLGEFCADLRSVWQQAGGPGLRALGARALLSKSQIGAILGGRVRRPPDWDVIRSLVRSFCEYAEQRGTAAGLPPGTGVEEYWRGRYAVVEHAFRRTRAVAGRVAGRMPARPALVPPRQLPPTVRTFVGRAGELAALTDLVETVTLAVIDGMAGVGKTTLAVVWAHRVTDRFPDGQLYVNLRGFDPSGPALRPAEVLDGFLSALGVASNEVPTTVDGQASLFRSLVAGRRMLVILDNARDGEQVRPLLPGAPGCLTVVTSRNGLASLVAVDDAYPLTLGPLSGSEASTLLAERIGTERLVAEPAVVDRIVAACAALPLALCVVAAHAAIRPDLTLADLATQLGEEHARADILARGESRSDLWIVFSWSYRALDPAAARLFRLLSLHPGPEVGVAAAASLAGRPVRVTARELASLRDANVLVEVAPGRFAMHDLLRAYATGLVTDAERPDALGRLLDHLLHTASAAAAALYPGRDRVELPAPRPGATVEPPPGVDGCLAWFSREHAVLTAAVPMAVLADLDSHAWQLAWTAADFLQRRGHWRDWHDTSTIGLSAARRDGAMAAQAQLHRNLGYACSMMGDHDRAQRHLSQALELYARLDDLSGRAATHRTLGSLLVRLGRVEDALAEDRRALVLYRATGDLAGRALTLNNTAWKNLQLCRYDEALAVGRQALALHRTAGNLYGEADTWDTIGCVRHHRGEHGEAIQCYRRALELFRNRGERYYEAMTLTRLGDTLYAAGHPEPAERAWRETTTILVQLNHPEAERSRLRRQPAVLYRQWDDPRASGLAR
jgi:tetratricopeptide (TPR) repeat protein